MIARPAARLMWRPMVAAFDGAHLGHSLGLDFVGQAYEQGAAGMVPPSRSFSDLITFTRGSTGGRFNAQGLYETVAANLPRFDYDPVTLAAEGLLIEEARTNLLIRSRKLSDANWVKVGFGAAFTATGVDGAANSASTLTLSTANGTIMQLITSASAVRATTAYVRRRTGTGLVEMTQDGGTTWTALTLTGSYARVGPPSATVVNPQVGFRAAVVGDAIDVDFVQCETGAFATSAIETFGVQVTRASDVASVNALSPWFGASAGTLLFEGAIIAGSPTLVQIDDGTENNVLRLAVSGGNLLAEVVSAAVVQASLLLGAAPAAGVNFKAALAYTPNDFAGCLNGGTVLTDAAGTVPGGLTTYRIGGRTTGIAGAQQARVSKVYPRRLSNPELQGITA